MTAETKKKILRPISVLGFSFASVKVAEIIASTFEYRLVVYIIGAFMAGVSIYFINKIK